MPLAGAGPKDRRLGSANSTTPSGGVKSSGCDRPGGPGDMETYLTIKIHPHSALTACGYWSATAVANADSRTALVETRARVATEYRPT